MEAMYINSKPHALLPEDRSRADGHRPSRRHPASDAGLDSGFAAVTPALLHSALSPSSPFASSASPASAALPTAYISSSTAAASPSVSLAAIASQHAASFVPARPRAPSSLRSSPAALPSSRLAKQHRQAATSSVTTAGITIGTTAGTSSRTSTGTNANNTNGTGNGIPTTTTTATTTTTTTTTTSTTTTTIGASSSPPNAGTTAGLPTTSFPPLFFGPGTNTTTPATSLVGAHGKSIPLDDTTAAHRTSALRELNSNFPSPVYRHRYAKPASAENSTYSQPVIVRTYSGPPPSASSSTHYRPPSSHRTNSRAAAARRIPLPPAPASVSASVHTVSSAAGGSSKHAPASSAGGVKDSLFGMARSKVKKGLLPWQWASSGTGDHHQDDPKLPPMEAFSYKGIMAELQATTDIRTDLDRIAEICARSHYSLSNQYDAHVAPHGSGAGFITTVTQRSKGRKKQPPGTGGPTLQAVPSDDDETGSRGARRRRGGAPRSGRRQSAAYGTLETIMSSSRSSEEDKTKKKSAAEIAEAVRGRAVRKAADTVVAAKTTETDQPCSKSGSKSGSGSKSPRGSGRGKRAGKDSVKATSAERLAEGRASPVPDAPPSAGSSGRSSGKRSHRRKPTSFAHAVMDSNKRHRSRSAKTDSNNPIPLGADASDAVSSTVALLSDPALPQTSHSQFEIRAAPGTNVTGHRQVDHVHLAGEQAGANGLADANGEPSGHDSAVDVNGTVYSPASDEDIAGFLSGLGNWFPWMAASGSNQPYHHHAKTSSQAGSHQAEGSLRELLKNVDSGKPCKGKAVVDHD